MIRASDQGIIRWFKASIIYQFVPINDAVTVLRDCDLPKKLCS